MKSSALKRIGVLYTLQRKSSKNTKKYLKDMNITTDELLQLSSIFKTSGTEVLYIIKNHIGNIRTKAVIDAIKDMALVMENDAPEPICPVLTTLQKKILISKTKSIVWTQGKMIDFMIFFTTEEPVDENRICAVILDYSLSGSIPNNLKTAFKSIKSELESKIEEHMVEIGKLSERIETIEKLV